MTNGQTPNNRRPMLGGVIGDLSAAIEATKGKQKEATLDGLTDLGSMTDDQSPNPRRPSLGNGIGDLEAAIDAAKGKRKKAIEDLEQMADERKKVLKKNGGLR
jgi:hypothetical protein